MFSLGVRHHLNPRIQRLILMSKEKFLSPNLPVSHILMSFVIKSSYPTQLSKKDVCATKGKKGSDHKRLTDSRQCTWQSTAILKFDLHKEQEKCKQLKAEAGLYKNMARTYWDRWQWELQKRRECLREQYRPQLKGNGTSSQTRVLPAVHQISKIL